MLRGDEMDTEKESKKKTVKRPGLYDNIDLSEATMNKIIMVIVALLIIAIILGIVTS